ncbi:MAG: hypothetical protein IRY85_22505 [Micromonosporaceae bacterium]|nr:hypothetical protein [Micromonosporaceae bacterium]
MITGPSNESSPPSLADFLAAPDEAVAAVMPPTVILSIGGTRRSAALSGVSTDSDDYAKHSRPKMIACFDLFFRLGARHIFNCVVRPTQFEEVGRYREQLVQWIDWGLGGAEALADYAERGWRVRIGGVEAVPELRELRDRLVAATPAAATHTLWLYVTPTRETLWQQMLAAARASKAGTQAELIRAILGEDVPPARLWIGAGKPTITPDQVPLAILGELNCYWTQRPGYDIDESMVRRIVYDFAYRRQTWRADKSSRYADIEQMRPIWESPRILGLGKRAGGFWYPDYTQDDEP